MRILFFTLLFASAISFANAQTETAGTTVGKFVQFYKANQPDSIYALFSPQMKAAINPEGTRQLLRTIKAQLGEVVRSHYAGAPADQVYMYLLRFQKPLVDLVLTIQEGLIAGLTQKAVQADQSDPAELESPDNISISNAFGTVYGTLLMPDTTGKTPGKIPVVLLIAGSGPTDRNMNQGLALRSNSFLMLARALAANGIASVRYDKRSVGKSTSTQDAKDLTLDNYIDDANLFVNLLKADVRFSKVIVAGHSEGAAIGILTALQTSPAAYISLSGPSGNIATALKTQLKTRINSADYKIALEVLDSLKAGKLFHRQLPQGLAALFALQVQPYIRSSMKYSSATEIAKLKIPVLLVSGTTDLQVGIEDTKLLSKADPKAKVAIITGMNHVMKSAPSDRELNLKTYNTPDLPIHPDLVPALVNFVKQVP